MRQSDQINELAAAMAIAQGKMDHASKDRTNPAFKSRYADLASVIDACRYALSDAGVAVLQPARVRLQDERPTVEVDTWLIHKTGQWVSETLTAGIPDTKAQTVGSAITYLRRYGLSAMVGVAPDDDDGAAASRPQDPREQQRQEPKPAVENGPAPTPRTTPQQMAARFVSQIIDEAKKRDVEALARAEIDKILVGSSALDLSDEEARAAVGTKEAFGPLPKLRDAIIAGRLSARPAQAEYPLTSVRTALFGRINAARERLSHLGAQAKSDAIVAGRKLDQLDDATLRGVADALGDLEQEIKDAGA